MRIGIDIDGVLADFVLAFTGVIARSVPSLKPYTTSEQPIWSFEDSRNGVTEEIVNASWEYVKRTYRWWESIPLLAPETTFYKLNYLATFHDITAVSARPEVALPSITAQTRAWLNRYQLHGLGLFMSSAKDLAATAGNFEIFLDDKPRNVMDVAGTGTCQAFVLTQPYNLGLNDPRIKRVASVEEFLQEIK